MHCRLFVLLAAALFASSSVAAEWMKFPDYRRVVLSNGVTLLLVEKRGNPLVHLSLALRSGSTQDPAGKEGLADITNDLLRKGAGSRTAEQISEELDFIGATLSTTISPEITRVQCEFLQKDRATALDLFCDLTLRPTFPAEEVTKLQKQRVDQLKARKDQPQAVIGDYYRQFLFGTHPYGRPETGDERSTVAVMRDDIVRFHQQTYVASNMIVVACGQFDMAEMERELTQRFRGLAAADIGRASVPAPEPVKGKRLLLVDKPDATQTFFRIGNVGITVSEPDRAVIQLVNTLFGGRFTSRLNTALRIDSGLSYGASSTFEPYRLPGSFHIGSFTKNASTEEALAVALKVLRALREEGISDAELASAKAYVKGQFGPTLETSDQIAGRLAYYEVYGLDAKVEVDQFAARIDAVTAADVRRVTAKVFPDNDLCFTLIGKAADIEKALAKFAPTLQKIPISAPGFGPSAN
jgi:zinc protease